MIRYQLQTHFLQPGDLIATADLYSMGSALYYFPEMVHLHIPNSVESQWGHVLDSMRPFFHEAEDRDKLFKEHDRFRHITTNIGPPFFAADIVRRSREWDAVSQPVVISNPSSFIEFRITQYARNGKTDVTRRGAIMR